MFKLVHKRGTTAQHAGYTGALSEATYDSDKKTLVVHDGVTPGGNPLASESVVAQHTSQLAEITNAVTLIEKIIVGYSRVTGATPPTWSAGSYYSNTGSAISPTYVLTASEPSNWATNWTDYYTYSSTGVAAVERTVTPEGSAYNLLRCAIKVTALQGTAAALRTYLYVNSTDKVLAYNATGVITNDTQITCIMFDRPTGYWECRGWLGRVGIVGALIFPPLVNETFSRTGNAVKIIIDVASGVIPSGSTIEIRGVQNNG